MVDIKCGDIIFVHGKGLISWLIEFFDKGRFSHVCMALNDKEIIESQYFVNTRKISNPYSSENSTIINLTLTEEQKEMLIEIYPKYLKEKYDFKQIIGLVLHYIFHLRTNHTWNNPNELICSELIIDLLHGNGYLSGVEYEKMKDYTPNMLFSYLYQREIKSA